MIVTIKALSFNFYFPIVPYILTRTQLRWPRAMLCKSNSEKMEWSVFGKKSEKQASAVINHIMTKLESSGYIFVVDIMGLASAVLS